MKILSLKGKWLLTLTCAMYMAMSAVNAAGAYLSGKTHECAELGNLTGVVQLCLIKLGLLVFSYLLTGISLGIRLAYLSNGELGIKDSIVHNLLRRPFSEFRRENSAFYLNLSNTDTDMYVSGFLWNIPLVAHTVASMVLSAILLWILHPFMLPAALAMAALPLLVTKPFANMRQKSKTAYSEASENYTNVLKETVEGCGAIRSNGREQACEDRHGVANSTRQRAWAKDFFIGQMSFESLLSMGGLSGTVCMLLGGWLVMQGIMSAGMIYSALNYFSAISNGFSNMTNYIVEMRSTKGTIEKLGKQRDMPCPVDSGLSISPQTDTVYEDVSFAFGDRQLYSGLTERFALGGCYAVVGESGSGKSTLLKLLLKYYDGYQGTISLGGQDIRQLSEQEVYKLVGVVDQNPYIFNASLYENITMFGGLPNRDSEEYHALLQKLNLTALAQRVGDVPLGDFGDNISGGERQRINIARALRRNPKILIFDEPTTGLDPENITMINEFIFNLRDVTRIVISHNWSEDYLGRFDNVIRIGSRKSTMQ